MDSKNEVRGALLREVICESSYKKHMALTFAPAASAACSQHMEKMRQAKKAKNEIRKGAIAQQIQLQEMNVKLH